MPWGPQSTRPLRYTHHHTHIPSHITHTHTHTHTHTSHTHTHHHTHTHTITHTHHHTHKEKPTHDITCIAVRVGPVNVTRACIHTCWQIAPAGLTASLSSDHLPSCKPKEIKRESTCTSHPEALASFMKNLWGGGGGLGVGQDTINTSHVSSPNVFFTRLHCDT